MSNIPPIDRYVAWARYNAHDGRSATTLHLCDSDAPGAFRVYRWPDVPQHDDRASLRHFLSAALVFGREGDAHARTMAAFDEWFRLHDAGGVPAADYLAQVEADPRRAAALQRARERAALGVEGKTNG